MELGVGVRLEVRVRQFGVEGLGIRIRSLKTLACKLLKGSVWASGLRFSVRLSVAPGRCSSRIWMSPVEKRCRMSRLESLPFICSPGGVDLNKDPRMSVFNC